MCEKTVAILKEIEEKGVGRHILLTNELKPAIINSGRQLAQIEKMLEEALEDVTTNRPNNEKKQRILDVASRIEEETRAAQEDARRRLEKDGKFGDFDAINRYIRIWSIAITLLGGGAETLKKETKRVLIGQITELTGAILDLLLKAFPRAIFDELRGSCKIIWTS